MKRIAFFLFCLTTTIMTLAQTPEIEWQNTIGTGATDILFNIKQTSDKGYILGGSTITTSNDFWIIKLDSIGNIEWEKIIGGSGSDGLFSVDITQTSDGGYILGGDSNSGISGDKTESSFGGYDYWVLKLDSFGAIEWQHTIGGDQDESLFRIRQTSDSGYLIGGNSYSGISGNKNEENNGLSDFWLVKTDSLGTIEWQNTIGGNDNDGLFDFMQTPDQGFIVGGSSVSDISGDKTEPNILRPDGLNSVDCWVLKLNSMGGIEWQNTIGGNNNEFISSLDLIADGGYILGCGSNSGISVDKTEENFGGLDFWIIKLNSVGGIMWQNTIGGSGEDGNYDINVSATFDDGFIVCGNSDSGISGDKTDPSDGYNDYWVVKIDSSGSIEWQNTIGGDIADIPFSTDQTLDGGYILGGKSNSGISGDKTEVSYFNGDYWIVKLYPDTDCTPLTFYSDIDGDGFGNEAFPILSCDTPAGYVTNNFDCDDYDAEINPLAVEICNDLDENCNGTSDDGISYFTYYEDADADSFGNLEVDTFSCQLFIEGYVVDSTDCDDFNNAIHSPILYYFDFDGDSFGDSLNTIFYCDLTPPDSYVLNGLDCDDENILVNPFSNEICNAIDDNCNYEIDEGLTVQTLFIDADGDNYGNSLIDTITCFFEIIGYVDDSTDCDDTDDSIYPGAEELLNGIDDNCNGFVDEGLVIIESYEINATQVYPNPSKGVFRIGVDNYNFDEVLIQVVNVANELIYSHVFVNSGKIIVHLPESFSGPAILLLSDENIFLYRSIVIIK